MNNETNGLVRTSLFFPHEMKKEIRQVAFTKNVSQSELIRKAVEEYLKKEA